MKNVKNYSPLFTLLLLLVLFTSACGLENLEIGDLQSASQTVEAGSAKAVQAEVNLGAGDLTVEGQAGELMEADFIYNVDAWAPEVSYSVTDGLGKLEVEQPSTENKFPFSIDDVRYEWDLRFNDKMPLELEVNMGAGQGNLALHSLNLESMAFSGGAGDVVIDLHSSPVHRLDISMGAGNLDLDLSGQWQQDLVADISGGVGSAALRLPAEAGVRVEVHGGLGEVETTGLNKNGAVYTNSSYGASDVTLEIQIDGGIGSIDLIVSE